MLHTLRFAAKSGVTLALLLGTFAAGYFTGYHHARRDVIPNQEQLFQWELPPLLRTAFGDS